MEHVFLHLIMFSFTMSVAMSDLLQNPDFEIPPANLTTNSSTSQISLLTGENPLPGWSVRGTVYYVTSGGGHSVQLAENGTINQTITGDWNSSETLMGYVLTFSLGGLSNEDCDSAAVNVSLKYTSLDFSNRSMVFYLQRNLSRNMWIYNACYLGRNLSRNMWENNAFYLGRIWKGDSINLEIQSVGFSNSSCWPVVDNFNVNIIDLVSIIPPDNMLANGGFEKGPAFPQNSSDGIRLYEDPDGITYFSPLQDWSIIGKVRYINSKYYKIPQGNAAVELLSGNLSSGVQTNVVLLSESNYTINFTMADANDSCVGDFLVYLQVDEIIIQNFSMRSNGTGSSFRHSVTFGAPPSASFLHGTNIMFYSWKNETRRIDGSICGPVLDDIVLADLSAKSSDGNRVRSNDRVLCFSLFLGLILKLLLMY